jgi:hypothetical protein
MHVVYYAHVLFFLLYCFVISLYVASVVWSIDIVLISVVYAVVDKWQAFVKHYNYSIARSTPHLVRLLANGIVR